MKNHILLVIIFGFTTLQLRATHYRGAEVTYRITGYHQVEATVTTYTKISGQAILADRDTISVYWGDGSSSLIERINGQRDSSCKGPGPCGQVIATDIKQNIYRGVHTYNNDRFYVITFIDDNLIGGIANVAAGNSIDVNVAASAVVYTGSNYSSLPGGADASPVFLNPPKYYAFVGRTYTYNCAAADPNGDSLSYSLITPKQDSVNEVPQYILPAAYCFSVDSTSNLIQINAQTGLLTWTAPCYESFYQIAIQVNQYRCGQFIGSVVRNMVITAITNTTVPGPQLSNVQDVFLQPGQSFQLPITAIDTVGFIDSLQVLGEAFGSNIAVGRPSFNAITGDTATGIFSWTPSDSFARTNAYYFSVIATNNFTASGPDGVDAYPASATKTFRVWVQDTTAPCVYTAVNNVPVSTAFSIYPNPASNQLHGNLTGITGKCTARIISVDGKVLIDNLTVTQSNFDINIAPLPAGLYFLQLQNENQLWVRKFVKE